MAKFEEWGLENIHEERFPFGQGWEVVRFNAHMVEPQVMPIMAPTMAPSTPSGYPASSSCRIASSTTPGPTTRTWTSTIASRRKT